MDPLVLEVLRFGTAILAGGLVAVIAGVIAFGNARRLQREEAERRDGAVRRALIAEIDENIVRIGDPTSSATWTPATIERSAWDIARALPLPTAVFRTVAKAYALGAKLNESVAYFSASAAVLADHEGGGTPAERLDHIGDSALKIARHAHRAFLLAAAELDLTEENE